MSANCNRRRDEVRKRSLELYVKLLGREPAKRMRDHLKWPSPFRHENDPSFTVYVENGRWVDFGDNAKGDVFDLIARLQQLDVHKDFLKILADAERLLGIPASQARNHSTTRGTARSAKPAQAAGAGSPKTLAELAPRYGLTAEAYTAQGCTVENGAVRYPTTRPDGSTGAKFKTLARRGPDNRRTCWHLKDDSKPGFFPASSLTGDDVLVVTGGEEKALAGLAAGFRTVTYTTGEGSLKPEAAAFLVNQGNREFIVAMDADEAGRKGAKGVAEALRKAGAASVRVCVWPDDAPKGKDLNDILRDDGPDALRQFLDAAQEAPDTLGSDAEAGEACGDIKAGRILADRIRGRMLWVCDLGQWFCWDGMRWKADAGDTCIMQAAKAAALERRNAAPEDSSHQETKAAVRGCDVPFIRRAIHAAQSEPDVFAYAGDLDTKPWLFNVLNGTLDLRKGQLRPHNPADRLTKLCPVDYDANAQAPTWDRVCSEAMCDDQESVRFLDLFFGYCLTGDCSEQVMVVMHGSGLNGKSVMTGALAHVLGDYCVTMDSSTIMASASSSRGAAREDLMALKGARLVLAPELNSGQRLDEACVKLLTGQDRITARACHRSFVSFEMTGKIVLVCNHLPAIHGRDTGIWRRIRVVPFKHTVAPEAVDKNLANKLKDESAGILARLVRGCVAWHQAGELPPARAVTAASQEYRQATDTLVDFLAERVVIVPGAKAQSAPLYREYVQYTSEGGERPVPQKRFSEMLAERGFSKSTQKGCVYWHGMELAGRTLHKVEGGRGSRHFFPSSAHQEERYNPLPPSTPTTDDDPEEAAMLAAERNGRALQ